MEFNEHNLIGVIIFLIDIVCIFLLVKVGKKCAKFLEETEEKNK
jgi:hypothetical protein